MNASLHLPHRSADGRDPRGRPTTDIAQIKRRLLKAIQELESIGYIKSLPPSERFTKDSVGTWEVHFERQPSDEQEQTTLQIEVEELSGTVAYPGASFVTGRSMVVLQLWNRMQLGAITK